MSNVVRRDMSQPDLNQSLNHHPTKVIHTCMIHNYLVDRKVTPQTFLIWKTVQRYHAKLRILLHIHNQLASLKSVLLLKVSTEPKFFHKYSKYLTKVM